MISLFTVHNNFVRVQQTLRVTPAAAEVDLTRKLRGMEWTVGLMDARAATPKKPGPKVRMNCRPRKSN